MDTNDNDIPPHLRRAAEVTEERSEDTTRGRAVLGVTFVDENGGVFSFQYSHLYRLYAEGACLVAEFSGHKVTMEGRKLFAPAKDCLLHMLAQHKREFVMAVVGGKDRDFGQADRPVVTSIRCEVLKP